MQKLSWFLFRIFLLLPLISLSMFAQQQGYSESQVSTREENPKKVLLEYVIKEYQPFQDDELRYFDAFVDLRGAGNEDAIVYLVGPDWCGTGGCPMVVLIPDGPTYRIVTNTSVVNVPIRVLGTVSHS